MSAIKGHASQGRVNHNKISGSGAAENFASVVLTDPKNRAGLDVLPKALYKIDLTEKVAETVNPADFPQTKNAELRIVKLTGNTVRKGDVLRFDTGLNAGMEIPVEIVDGDNIYLAGELVADPDGDDFFHMRHITLTLNDNGSLEVSQGPLEFIKDGVETQVEKDTVDSSNNVGLPVEIVGADGTEINLTAGDINIQSSHTGANPDSIQIGDGTETVNVNASNELQVRDDDANTTLTSLDGKDFATETTLEAARVLLNSLDGKDFATQTTLAALLTAFNNEDFASETTLAALAAEDFATETTLANLLATDFATSAKQDSIITELQSLVAQATTGNKRVIETLYSSAPTIPTATRLNTGLTIPADTLCTELEILTKSGNNFTAYDASSGGNVIARFTQAGGRIPVNLAATTAIFLQSDTGSDFTATDLTINAIGVPV